MDTTNKQDLIPDYVAKLAAKSATVKNLRVKLELFNSALSQIESYRYPVKVVFFGKSVAFRVGTNSIKDIKLSGISGLAVGYKTAFKVGFIEDLTQILTSGTTTMDKHKLVLLSAAYYVLFKRDSVIIGEGESTKAESTQIIQAATELSRLKNSNDYILIKMGKKTYKVDEFKKIYGTPKADAAFYYKNNPVIYLSLKKGSGPVNFQQYGGWAGDLNIKTRYDAKTEPVVEGFVSRVENIFSHLGLVPDQNGRFNFNMLKTGSYFGKPVDNQDVEYKVKFGKDYSRYTPFGINNVHALIDGDIRFEYSNGVYTIGGKYHIELNPVLDSSSVNINENKSYKPVLLLSKSEKQGLNQGGFSNARASIWPNNSVAQTATKNLELAEQLIKEKQIDKLKNKFLK